MAWICTRFLVRTAGGKAVRITPSRPRMIESLDALILGGGADIQPVHYNEEILVTIQKQSAKSKGRFAVSVGLWLLRKIFSVYGQEAAPNPERDQLELSLLKGAVERKIPVLGICRGAQLINIYFGGTLYQDITEFYVEEPLLQSHRPRKAVTIAPSTRLAQILSEPQIKVNSLHHQSVKDLGRGLVVSAREKNGIVQAIEHPEFDFLIGLQWHPEYLPYSASQRRFFRKLIESAS